MKFLEVLLKVVGYLPSIIVGIEGLFGSKNGQQKQNAAVDLAGLALQLQNAVAAKDVVDPQAFQDGLKKAIEGIVQMLNASVWYKKS